MSETKPDEAAERERNLRDLALQRDALRAALIACRKHIIESGYRYRRVQAPHLIELANLALGFEEGAQ